MIQFVNIRLSVSILVLGLGIAKLCIAQDSSLVIQTNTKINPSVYTFLYIPPNKEKIIARVPDSMLSIYTLSRFLDLKSLSLRIPVLIGVSKKGERLIIFDKNRNNDFTDDSIIIFKDTITEVRDGNYKTFELSLNDSLRISFDYSIIKSNLAHVYLSDEFENNFWFVVRPREYKVGVFALDGQTLQAYLFTQKPYSFERNSTFLEIVSQHNDSSETFLNLVSAGAHYKVGDKIALNNHFYIFSNISGNGNKLIFTPILETLPEGFNVGFNSPRFRNISLNNDSIILDNFIGKYILLDFWGTWCGPCKVVNPSLKELHLKYNDLKMIGVVYDDDVEKVKAYILNDHITWDQVFIKRNEINKESLIDEFTINKYPSFILIDRKGKISFRDEGIDGYARLADYLNKLHF